MVTVLKRLMRRVETQAVFLKLGIRDRVEAKKSLWLERVSNDGTFAQVSLIWSDRQFPAALLTDSAGAALQAQDLGCARLARITGGRFRHYFWLALSDGVFDLPLFAGRPMRLRGATGLAPQGERRIPLQTLRGLLVWPAPRRVCATMARQRAAACARQARDRFAGAWVLMDRADRADDNAEHFYRYLQGMPEADRIFFVLDPNSPDWPRLKAEGFRLLAFGSADHVAAVAQAAIIASSQASSAVLWPLPKPLLRDIARYHFVFLQHGVIINDLSSWLNQLPIDLLVTTTPAEFSAISAPDSPYRFSARDIVLAGLPRHDALLVRPRQRRWLTIAPTWRKWLAGQVDPLTMRRARRPGFARSEFAHAWGGLVADPRLAAVARANGLEILFVPHPNLRPELGGLALPEHVQIHDPAKHGSYQQVIAASALSLTDYSSLTVDMAVLAVPQVYYQFDAEAMLGGAHSMGAGYFDYARDGFGPVTCTIDEALEAVSQLLRDGEDQTFVLRRQRTLIHRDKGNCDRIRRAILDRLLPNPNGVACDGGP